jgi:hypothetical protein
MAGTSKILIIEEKDNNICLYRKGIETREEILEILDDFISDFFADEFLLISKQNVKIKSTNPLI